jgi:hypothetical protein
LDKKHDHKWIQTVNFKMRYRNPNFSLYEIGMNTEEFHV